MTPSVNAPDGRPASGTHEILFTVQVDCEATRPGAGPSTRGERTLAGLAETLAREGLKATFAVVPSDLAMHWRRYRELERAGHEIGLHLHSEDDGGRYWGQLGAEEQRERLVDAMAAHADVMGRPPEHFTPGCASANRHTYSACETAGLRHGTVSIPLRDRPEIAACWAGAPRDVHCPGLRRNGDSGFVEVPLTVLSPGCEGGDPFDLRIERLDDERLAETARYSLARQEAADAWPPYVKALTHNTHDYAESDTPCAGTLTRLAAAVRLWTGNRDLAFVPATTAEIARRFRHGRTSIGMSGGNVG